MALLSISSLLLLLASPSFSQYIKCPAPYTVNPAHGQPRVADGYTIQLVTNGLGKPRSILFDRVGRLLMVNSGAGVWSITVNNTKPNDNTGCWYMSDYKRVISDTSLNHGLALSQDGRTLLTTSSQDLKSWSYDGTRKAVGMPQTVVTDMEQDGHVTRTLLIPRHKPDTVIVSRGSAANIDTQAANISSGHSQLKRFTWTDPNNYGQEFNDDGDLLAWGLRNSVGLAEDKHGDLWSVENSADNVDRNGVDFHQDNPAEELNYHGDATKKPSGDIPNFGYPNCLAAWNASEVPQDTGLKTGQQFATNPNSNVTDSDCKDEKKYVRPRLAFQAHMAPLDISFYNPNETIGEFNCTNGFGCDHLNDAFVSFHGSWDRSDPIGYKLSYLEFGDDGQPKESEDSTTAVKDIVWNDDNSQCPDKCFRPVGIAFDRFGNLWMTSDSTGELYVISRTNRPNVTITPSGTTSTSTSKPAKAGASGLRTNGAAVMGLVVFLGVLLF